MEPVVAVTFPSHTGGQLIRPITARGDVESTFSPWLPVKRKPCGALVAIALRVLFW